VCFSIIVWHHAYIRHKDLLFFGNNEFFKLRLGRSDANYGTLLLGNGKGNFKYMPQSQSGLLIKGDVRGALRIGDEIILGIYGDSVKALHINKPKKTKSDETALSK